MLKLRDLTRLVAASTTSLALLSLVARAEAAPSDLAPQGSNLVNSFATLADAGYLGDRYSAVNFYTNQRYSRSELAHILEAGLLSNSDQLTKAEASSSTAPALVVAVKQLEPELKLDGVDVGTIEAQFPKYGSELHGYLQPEYRGEQGNPIDSDPKSVLGYGVSADGILGTNSRYVVSSSNYSQDYRNLLNDDTAVDDSQVINEAYVELQGKRGFTFDAGRMSNEWGPEYLGSPLFSGNAPALDQLKVAFPFSLGKNLGRNYDYTEFASTFSEFGVQKYLLGRRINYQFNSKWNAEWQEALKSSATGSLWEIPLPFAVKSQNWSRLPGNFGSINDTSKYSTQLGLGYQFDSDSRLYSQFMVNDFKQPYGEQNKSVPRKIVYVVGASLHPLVDTRLTLEYGYSDPTSYTYQNTDAIWQAGAGNQIGMPEGPNSKDEYARIDQRVGSRLTLTADIRNRDRASDSFPEPTAREEQIAATYALNKKNWVGLSFEDYKQDPFPYSSGSSLYPVPNNYVPSETVQGNLIRLQEVDVSYGIAF